MVPMLNHSLFININNNIIKVITEIIKAIGLEIVILSCFIITSLELGSILPVIVKLFKIGLILYVGE